MAKNKSTVYLGYDDEEIPVKQAAFLNSCTNKIGGTPNWPKAELTVPVCPLCGTVRPLIVQMYVPLDRSQFHRNLFIFACISPTCSQNSKSWVCVRTQNLDTQFDLISEQSPKVAAGKQKKKYHTSKANSLQNVNWCSGADDWGEDDAMGFTGSDKQKDETNGNVRSSTLPYAALDDFEAGGQPNSVKIGDDEDDESTSAENDMISAFGQIEMNSPRNSEEDPNANCAVDASVGEAIASVSATICAEIEASETDVVLVDTPKKPERDLIALLKHTFLPATLGPLSEIKDITLKSFYIAVDVEANGQLEEFQYYDGALSMDHIRDLYQKYKLHDENPARSPLSAAPSGLVTGAGECDELTEDQESYEKGLPAHGDVLFHNFITTIQQSPGQVLRYTRDALPLLAAALTEPQPKCQNCKSETICEVQILPTLIPKLIFQQNNISVPIEFGNVLIFTCLKSCWDTPDKMRYEHVIVQSET